jgi:CrcB protein
VEPEHRSQSRPSRAGRIAARTDLDRQELAAVFAGGFIGALARAGLVEALPVHPGQWPWPTFAANLAAALMLGYFTTRLQERLPPSRYRRSFLGSGVCGALSTFSTMMVELVAMADRGEWGLAGAYTGASMGGGLLIVLLVTKGVRRARIA